MDEQEKLTEQEMPVEQEMPAEQEVAAEPEFDLDDILKEFSDEPAEEAPTQAGVEAITLGKRILRTETAAITAVSMCMLYAEMMVEND